MKERAIVFITTADTDILAASSARRRLPEDFPDVRMANPGHIPLDQQAPRLLGLLAGAGIVVLRLLTGKRSLGWAFDHIVERCGADGIPLIACPGYQEWDHDLVAACSVPRHDVEATLSYLMQSGVQNLQNLLLFLSDTYLGTSYGYTPPQSQPWEGVYHPDGADAEDVEGFIRRRWVPGRPSVGILFYRAHWLSGNVEFIDNLVRRLEELEANVLPVFAFSLKHSPDDTGEAPRALREFVARPDGTPRVDCLISTMSFSMGQLSTNGSTIAGGWSVDYLRRLDVPMIQAIVSTSRREEWEARSGGLSPLDTAMNVAMPEFDGRVITVPFAFKEEAEGQADGPPSNSGLQRYGTIPDRVDLVARLALRWATLRRKPNSEKRIGIILSNSPARDARIGNAVGLDTPASVVKLLHALQETGYQVSEIPETGDELVQRIIDRCSNDRDYLTDQQLRLAAGHVDASAYRQWFQCLSAPVRRGLRETWGEPPGQVYRTGDRLAIAGVSLGNVFIGLQPPRGFGENPIAIYHNPDLAPTHHYLAYYRWLRDVCRADAIIHMGKHGNLEWLPGKGVGLSGSCFPDAVLDDLPLLYPFIVNNPGEGAQAKRRARAVIVDHLVPPMTTADSYGQIARLEQYMDEYAEAQAMDPKRLPVLEEQIWRLVQEANLDRDLQVKEQPDDFAEFLLSVDGYICELKDSQIRSGLHVLGEAPEGEQLVGLLMALTRLDMGDLPSLRRAMADALGLDYDRLLGERGAPVAGAVPQMLSDLDGPPLRTRGDLLERLESLGRRMYSRLLEQRFDVGAVPGTVVEVLGSRHTPTERVLGYVTETLYPALLRTEDEVLNILRGLEGRFVPPGPSGAPTRGMANVLPTGRNFYSVDPNSIPSPAAWEIGKGLARALLEKYLQEQGAYPEAVGIVVWGTANMRTHGDDIAQVLYLLGVRPLWQPESRRVTDLEVIPLAELGRPRIDVTVRISGFFRDAFPNLVHLLDRAVEMVAAQDESPEDNFLVKHVHEDSANRKSGAQDGLPGAVALYRIFGAKPGAYGSGLLNAIDQRNWESERDLAEVYSAWSGYAYSRESFGVEAPDAFRRRFSQLVIAAKNQDNREHDIFDSDDYFQDHGGMIATVRALTGRSPRQFFGDSADPSRPRVRDLQDEARRVFRSRVVNPKWVESMKRHGYKGAFELAATVDYMFGYDATTGIVEDWMYARLTETYALDAKMQEFFRQSNPWALKDIAERLLEAMERGLWKDPPEEMRLQLQRIYLQLEEDLEARQERKIPG